ncbi:MAG TPA: Lrp/AsnC family transcriptional regulator [Nitrolancea sp.]|nr:Lrp/AsnC family transcriptional regulator [Nitrolancea sp.]
MKDQRQDPVFAYTSPNGVLDELNNRILIELQCEPRLTMAELGRRVGLSSPAVTERVRRLEEAGVIRGYRLDVDPAALGLPLAAYVRVRPHTGQLSRIAELARSIPEIVECHRVTGEDCFIMKVYIPAMDQLDRLLDRFLVYGSTTTSIIQSSPVPLRAVPVDRHTDAHWGRGGK